VTDEAPLITIMDFWRAGNGPAYKAYEAKRVRPAPIVSVTDDTRVTHVAADSWNPLGMPADVTVTRAGKLAFMSCEGDWT
jgi:hypothetical protein